MQKLVLEYAEHIGQPLPL